MIRKSKMEEKSQKKKIFLPFKNEMMTKITHKLKIIIAFTCHLELELNYRTRSHISKDVAVTRRTTTEYATVVN